MADWLPSYPYPPAGPGYWDPVTSTLNWCEEDYYATIYSAEIVNSLTNLLFVFLGFKGIYSCIRNDHDRIYIVTYIGYLLVGTGSFLFHSTLKYPMQLVDELSMIYSTCLMMYASFSYQRSRSAKIALAMLMVSIAVFITGYYHYLQDPTFHQNAYALLTAIVLLRAMFVMEFTLRPSLRAKYQAQAGNSTRITREQERKDARDSAILKHMWLMVAYGLSIFLGGFAIWNLDNRYCSNLRRWRHQIGLPWGIFLEGHGWWHLMTGVGAYFYITWGIWLRHCLNGKQDEYELQWPRLITSIPVIVRRDPTDIKSIANGTSKKNL